MLDSPGADLFTDDDGIENDAQRPVRKRSPRNDVVNPPHWLIKKRLRVAFHCLNKARSAPQTDSRTICDHSIARRTVGLLRRRFPRSSFSSVSSRLACRSSSFMVVSASLRLCSSSLAVPRSQFVLCNRHYGSLGRSRKGRVLDYTVPRDDAHLADRLLICQLRSTFARLRRYRKSDSIPQDECAFPPSPQRLAPELSRPACASNRVVCGKAG